MAATNADTAGALTPAAASDAKPEELKPATDVAASGALIEPEVVGRLDTVHPAVDANPRAGQPARANQVDFNDPTVPGHVQTARRLGLKDDYDAPKADAKA